LLLVLLMLLPLPDDPNPVQTLYTRPNSKARRKCQRGEAFHRAVMNFIVVDFMIAVCCCLFF